jgi:hypothetical protein
MVHELSRGIFVGLTVWFASITAYVVVVARFVDPINETDAAVLIVFAILAIATATAVSWSKPDV